MNKFFWWAAGVNKDILEEYPTEYSKYTGMGATIVVTSIMAMFTGGYAISRIFDNLFLTIFFSLFWGTLIFVFDRFIVSTVIKEEGQPWWKEAIKYGPRIVMAVFLGMIIAMPLKLRIFAKEIEGEIVRYQKDYVRKEGLKVRGNYKASISSLEKRKKELTDEKILNKKEISAAHELMSVAHYEMTCEAQGGVNCGGAVMAGTGKSGRGRVYREKREKYERLSNEYNVIREENKQALIVIEEELNLVKKSLTEKEAEQEADVKSLKGDYVISNGILAEMEALDRLASSKDHNGMGAKILFFTMFFILIEIAPVLTKWMMKVGPYDFRLAKITHDVKLSTQKYIHDLNHTIKTEIERTVTISKQDLEGKLKSNEAVTQAISDAQVEVVKEALTLWKDKQIEMVKKNPQFIIKDIKSVSDIDIPADANDKAEKEGGDPGEKGTNETRTTT